MAPPKRSPTRPLQPGLLASLSGVISTLGLVACESDPCDGLRTFDAPPEPNPTTTSPPMVIDGEWIGAGVLELSFSEPLASGTPPDPSRFAVLGWSATVGANGSYYYGGGSSDSCYVQTRYGGLGQGYYSRASVADVWIAPEDPSLLRLRMSSAGATCRSVNDIVAQGVMLVYTNEPTIAGAQLLDADGDPVPDLGPSWAVSAWDGCSNSYGYYYCGYALNNTATGHLPALSSLAEIPCPS